MTRYFNRLLMVACLTVLALSQAWAMALIRPVGYSPQQVTDLGLQTERSAPLTTIGVGQPAYFRSEHEGTYTWSLTGPSGSTAALSSTSEREIWFKPDKKGQFKLTLDFTDSLGVASSAELTITGAFYVGVGNIGGATPGLGQCALCHPDKATEWATTDHSSMLQRGLDGIVSSHYAESCLECHTTGYDTDSLAVNGGFDDVAKDLSWTFPDSLFPGVYDSMVANYPKLAQLGNIQCESCHGPGSEHNGNTAKISKSHDAGLCAHCHEEGTRHYFPTAWRNSRHGLAIETTEAFNRSGNTCVPCHTSEGFTEVNLSETHTSTAPYDHLHGVTCQVCHDPHEQVEGGEFQLRVVQDYNTAQSGPAIYETDGTAAHACDVCHHLRPGTDAPGSRPHESHQTDMLNGTAGYRYADKTYPESNAHNTLNANRCVDCHMHTAPSVDDQNYIGGHTFSMFANANPDDPNAPPTDLKLTDACVTCHPGIGADFDYQGIQTKITRLLDKMEGRMVFYGEGSASYLIGSPRYSQADVDAGTITQAQFYAAYNYNIVHNDGSRGVHNPKLALALLEDALETLPKSSACAACDINNDGKLAISDAIKLILASKEAYADCNDRNDDLAVDVLDVIDLLSGIWGGTCPEQAGMLAAAGVQTLEIVSDKMNLTKDQIDYIEAVLIKMNLTQEQKDAFSIALYGQAGRSGLPKAFALAQNAPNPFNPATTISYSVPEGKTVAVSLRVYDIRGKLIRTLVNETRDAGNYTIFWDGSDESGNKVASGVYLYRMQAGSFNQTRKMVVLK